MRVAALAAAIGIAVFAAASALPNVELFDRGNRGDTPLYETYGQHLRAGELPYRDFFFEYPPGAIPMMVAPTVADDYRQASKLLQWLLGAITILLVALALASAGFGRTTIVRATLLIAVAPPLLGRVTFTRFDWWPAALTAGALAALVAGRHRLGAGVLAVAVSAKEWPLVLVPLALLWTWRQRGKRETTIAAGVFLVVLVAIVLPFVVLGPGGVRYSLHVQLVRPLQIESLGGSLLLAAHQLGLYDPTVVSTYGSQNLVGSAPDALQWLTTVLQLAALGVIYVAFARSRRSASDLLLAAAAAVAAFVAFGKILSPQYVIWLVPLVALVVHRRWRTPVLLLALALGLTQLWSQGRYHDVVHLRALGWAVLARDLVLVGLVAVLGYTLVGGSQTTKRSTTTRS